MMTKDYREILDAELRIRMARNSKYSQRAFSRDIKLSASFLNKLMNGKAKLSNANAQSLCRRLKWNSVMTGYFCALVALTNARSKTAKEKAAKQVRLHMKYFNTQMNQEAQDQLLNWYDLAVMEMTYIDRIPKTEAAWAKSLGVDEDRIKHSVARLKSKKVLAEKNGKLIKVNDVMHSSDEVSSQDIRALHKQCLERAIPALQIPHTERDNTALCFSIDSSKLGELKDAVRDFRIKVSDIIQSSEKSDTVMMLLTQIFPLIEKSK